MKIPKTNLISILRIIAIAIVTIILANMVFICLPFNYRKKLTNLIHLAWGYSLSAIMGLKIKIEGLDQLDKNRQYMIACNHQSLTDVVVLYRSLPLKLVFVYKKDLAYVPFFGWALYLCHFGVDRLNKEKSLRNLEKAKDKLLPEENIVMFPEGTRSPDGRLLPFKNGAFIMAIQMKMPVLPIVIKGTCDIIPKKSFIVRSGEVSVHILDPIETDDLILADKERLKNLTYDRMKEITRQ